MSDCPTEQRQTVACAGCWTQSLHLSCDGQWKMASEITHTDTQLRAHTHYTVVRGSETREKHDPDGQQMAGVTHTHCIKVMD